jgi:hypothetical protein
MVRIAVLAVRESLSIRYHHPRVRAKALFASMMLSDNSSRLIPPHNDSLDALLRSHRGNGVSCRSSTGADSSACSTGVLVYTVSSSTGSGQGPIRVHDATPSSGGCNGILVPLLSNHSNFDSIFRNKSFPARLGCEMGIIERESLSIRYHHPRVRAKALFASMMRPQVLGDVVGTNSAPSLVLTSATIAVDSSRLTTTPLTPSFVPTGVMV